MAPTSSLLPRGEEKYGRPGEPMAGTVMSVILAMVSITILSIFLTQRSIHVRVWRRLPYVVWLVFAIYIDSYLFVFATAVLQLAFGVNSSLAICSGAILLCLVCYVTTKVFIYLFLVEKAYIIRGSKKPRMKSKLYLFNSFGMLGIYIVVAILNFIFRITRMENGVCIIGMKNIAMIPLISFDAVVNVYLTILFLIPLKNLYSFKGSAQPSLATLRLRTIAMRTFVGAICTLASSIVNLSVLMALGGEPGWVCLMCCNSDILFSAVIIQWITSKDNAGTSHNSGLASRRTGDPNAPNGTFDDGDYRRPRLGSGSFSPNMTSTSKCGGLEDVAELTLHSSSLGARSDSPHSSEDLANSTVAERTKVHSLSEPSSERSKVPSPGSVVVTTTIKRESKPSASVYDVRQEGHDRARGSGGRTASGLGRGDSYMRQSARTKITGGTHH